MSTLIDGALYAGTGGTGTEDVYLRWTGSVLDHAQCDCQPV